MSDNLQKQWIVLLNKSPRGPFNASEIQSLIHQKVIRHNDVAYLIPEDSNSERATWKFLWQFEEFDSRKNEKNNPPPVAVLEKRQAKTDDEIVAQVAEQVPLDLQSIRPEDLIVRTASAVRREVSPQRETRQKEPAAFSPKFERPSLASGSLSALFALVAFGSLAWLGYGKYKELSAGPNRDVSSQSESKTAVNKAAVKPMEKGVPRARNQSAMRIPGTNPQLNSKPIVPPQARDRGEINQEERRRLHQEELRREAEERERAAAQRDEKEPDGSDDESGDESGNRGKKAKRNVSDEESTGIEGEAPPSAEGSSGEDQPPSSWLED